MGVDPRIYQLGFTQYTVICSISNDGNSFWKFWGRLYYYGLKGVRQKEENKFLLCNAMSNIFSGWTTTWHFGHCGTLTCCIISDC